MLNIFCAPFPYFMTFLMHIRRRVLMPKWWRINFSLLFSPIHFRFDDDNRICQRKQQRIHIKLKNTFLSCRKQKSLGKEEKNSVKYGSRWSNNIFLCFWFYDSDMNSIFFRWQFFGYDDIFALDFVFISFLV